MSEEREALARLVNPDAFNPTVWWNVSEDRMHHAQSNARVRADDIIAAGWTPPRVPTEHELIEEEVNKLMRQEGWNGLYRHTLTRSVVQPYRDRVLAGERANTLGPQADEPRDSQ